MGSNVVKSGKKKKGKNMKKLYFMMFSFLLFIPVMTFAASDVLQEYEELLAKVSGNYKEALRAPESRFGQDYEKILVHFVAAGRSLQREAKVYGDDYNFGTLSQNVENMFKRTRDFLKYRKDGKRDHSLFAKDFKEQKMKDPYRRQDKRSRNKSSSRSTKNRQHKEEKRTEFLRQHDPLPIIKILVADMKNLQKSNFANPGKTLQVNKNVEEYKRCVDFYRQHFLIYIYRKNSPQYNMEVKRRANLMLRSAQTVMELAGKKNGAELPCNLSRESSILLRVTGFYAADTASAERRGEEARSHHNRQEAQYSFRKIHDTLAKLRKNTILAPEKYVVKTRAGLPEKGVDELQELPERELKKKLGVMRKMVLDSNKDMNGVDKTTLKKFRALLSKGEIKNFDRICKEYVKNGYDESTAARYACVRFVNTGAVTASRSELLQLFARFEKELTRDAERDKKLDF